MAPTVHIDPRILDLIPPFLRDLGDDVSRAERLARDGDFGALGRLGHRWLGSGAAYGFTTVSEVGAALECAAASESVDAVARVLGMLRRYLSVVVLEPAPGARP